MKIKTAMSVLCLAFAVVSASCRSDGGADGRKSVPEFREIEGCSLSVPCMIVTPDTLDSLPGPVAEAAGKHCGKPGTVVVASSLRPRYLRMLRDQGRLLLGSVEVNPSRETVYLCVLEGIGEAADTSLRITVENPEAQAPWNLGVFVKRYPELAAHLGELPPDDERLAAAEPAALELLRRGSTRALLEKQTAGATSDALEDARRSEQEQIAVLEDILNSR